MPKRKTHKKPVRRFVPKLQKEFDCPFCQNLNCISVHIERNTSVARLACRICVARYVSRGVSPVIENIDVYSEWLDQCAEVNQAAAGSGSSGGGEAPAVEAEPEPSPLAVKRARRAAAAAAAARSLDAGDSEDEFLEGEPPPPAAPANSSSAAADATLAGEPQPPKALRASPEERPADDGAAGASAEDVAGSPAAAAGGVEGGYPLPKAEPAAFSSLAASSSPAALSSPAAFPSEPAASPDDSPRDRPGRLIRPAGAADSDDEESFPAPPLEDSPEDVKFRPWRAEPGGAAEEPGGAGAGGAAADAGDAAADSGDGELGTEAAGMSVAESAADAGAVAGTAAGAAAAAGAHFPASPPPSSGSPGRPTDAAAANPSTSDGGAEFSEPAELPVDAKAEPVLEEISVQPFFSIER